MVSTSVNSTVLVLPTTFRLYGILTHDFLVTFFPWVSIPTHEIFSLPIPTHHYAWVWVWVWVLVPIAAIVQFRYSLNVQKFKQDQYKVTVVLSLFVSSYCTRGRICQS
jgi:hypothetical protein